jgi:hypothetical protein
LTSCGTPFTVTYASCRLRALTRMTPTRSDPSSKPRSTSFRGQNSAYRLGGFRGSAPRQPPPPRDPPRDPPEPPSRHRGGFSEEEAGWVVRFLPADVGVAGLAGLAPSDSEGSRVSLRPFLLDRRPGFDDAPEVSGVSARRLVSPSRAEGPLTDLVSPPSTDGEPSPPPVWRTDLASNASAMSRAPPISLTPHPHRASGSDRASDPKTEPCAVVAFGRAFRRGARKSRWTGTGKVS